MPIKTEKFNVTTQGFTDILDITNKVQDIIAISGIKEANVFIYVSGSTASITTLEFEPGLIRDLPEALENIAPVNKDYFHNKKWNDGNGHAHLRSAIIGNSVNVPLFDGHLVLGTWQQIVLVDFDNKPRTRTIMVQILY